MNKFNDFGIKPTSKVFTGKKIEIESILNTDIKVYEFRVVDSKYKKERGHNKCLHLQISIGETKHVVFSASATLIDMIQQVPESGFPFTTKIIKDNKQFQFT